ncbi:hypothetical protein WG66_014299 [Moniliophthora roreri]|nr:hypothetical protein WG66_014299 [Moniliophthora roreri]
MLFRFHCWGFDPLNISLWNSQGVVMCWIWEEEIGSSPERKTATASNIQY